MEVGRVVRAGCLSPGSCEQRVLHLDNSLSSVRTDPPLPSGVSMVTI